MSERGPGWTPRVIEGGAENPLQKALHTFEEEILSSTEWNVLLSTAEQEAYDAALEVQNTDRTELIESFIDFVAAFTKGHWDHAYYDPSFIQASYNYLKT